MFSGKGSKQVLNNCDEIALALKTNKGRVTQLCIVLKVHVDVFFYINKNYVLIQ